MTQTVTVQAFANEVGVSRDTIERAVKRGDIKAAKKNPFGGRTSPLLIPVVELKRWKKMQEKALGKK